MINLFVSVFLLIIGVLLAYYEIKLIKSYKYKHAIIFLIFRFICFFGTGFYLSEFIKYILCFANIDINEFSVNILFSTIKSNTSCIKLSSFSLK